MRPIVVSHPRAGSEIISNIIFNYTKQIWQTEGFLNEFLLISFYKGYNYSFVNNKIEGSSWTLPGDQWTVHWDNVKDKLYNITQERITWLQSNPNYVFKLMVTPKLTDSQYNWCLNNYHCVFLQRRDTVRSFLSFLLIYHIGTHHSLEANTIKKENLKIKFNIDFANRWIWNYRKYIELLNRSTDKSVLVYEDTLDQGVVNEERVLNTLGWAIPANYEFYKFQTKPTPYEDQHIVDYFENKNEVLDFIKQYPEIFDQTVF